MPLSNCKDYIVIVSIAFIFVIDNLGHANSLDLFVPKLIQTSPNLTQDYEGNRHCMLCVFNSTTPINVTWSKDDKIISNGKRVHSTTFAKFSSRILNRLCINDLLVSDTGIYKCIGSNQYGGTASGSFQFKVLGQYKPIIYQGYPPSKLVLYNGQEYRLSCKADGYPTVEKYSWTKKSGFIDNHRVQVSKNSLIFTNALSVQAGEYVCKAENSKGTAFKSVQVSVVSNPAWLEKPRNRTLVSGDFLSLSGSFYGSETELKTSWYLNNALVHSERIPKKQKAGSAMTTSYSVVSAQVQHSGRYVLEIQNRNGRITSAAEVVVYSKPEVIITEGVQLSATEGDSIQITCTAQGYPSPSVTWSSGGRTLAKTSVDSTSRGHKIKSSLTHLIYAVKGVKIYLCSAENERGRDQGLITVSTNAKKIVSSREKQPSSKSSDLSSQVPVIIGVISAIIILIVILILVCMVFYRRRKSAEVPRQGSNSVKYGRAHSSYDEDGAELIPDDVSAFPDDPPVLGPRQSKRLKSLERPKIGRPFQRQSLNDRLKSKVHFLESQYAVILPLGQGRLLAYEDLDLGEKCGSGQFGVVVKGTLAEENNTRRDVAVKMLKDNAGLAERKMMLDELNLMKMISHHPNVVALVGWVITEDNVFIVEELVSGGSLLHYLRSQRTSLQAHYVNISSAPLTGKDAFTFAWQIAAGMKYLSSQNIVHRDLAARNILMAHENICKISDFGLARQIYQNSGYKKTNGGELPVRWIATESLFKGLYTSESDVWSFGILLWEIVNLGEIPYPNIATLDALVDLLKAGKRMEKPLHCSEALYNLMLSCWQEAPSKRPDFAELTSVLGKMLFDKATHIDFTGLESYLEKIQEAAEDEDELIATPNQRGSLLSAEI